MKLIISFLFMIFFSFSSYCMELQDTEWTHFRSKDEKFSIELPSKPKRGHFIKYLYEIYQPKDSLAEFPYLIVVLNNPTNVINLEGITPEQIAEWKNTMEMRLFWFLAIIKPGLTVDKSDFLLVDGSPAIDCEMSNEEGETLFGRMLMVGNRIYFLGATFDKGPQKAFESTYDRMINSFKATP